MKKLFLYAARDSAAFRHLESFLHRLSFGFRLVTLPPGTRFTSPLSLELRSSDPLVLYAGNDEDLDDLLRLRDEYDSFRILLVMRSCDQANDTRHRLLTPRMVFFLDTNLRSLPHYLRNLFRQAACEGTAPAEGQPGTAAAASPRFDFSCHPHFHPDHKE